MVGIYLAYLILVLSKCVASDKMDSPYCCLII